MESSDKTSLHSVRSVERSSCEQRGRARAKNNHHHKRRKITGARWRGTQTGYDAHSYSRGPGACQRAGAGQVERGRRSYDGGQWCGRRQSIRWERGGNPARSRCLEGEEGQRRSGESVNSPLLSLLPREAPLPLPVDVPSRARAYIRIHTPGWLAAGWFLFLFRVLRRNWRVSCLDKISNSSSRGWQQCVFSRFRLCSELSLGPGDRP